MFVKNLQKSQKQGAEAEKKSANLRHTTAIGPL
jgi:hypothetical protein